MRTLAFLLPLLILAVLTDLANHLLTVLHVHFFLGGLFVVHAALQADRRSAVAAVALAGLWLDASAPVPFGLHAVLLVAACLVLWNLRHPRLRVEEYVSLPAALTANAALFLIISLQQSLQAPAAGAYWLRSGVDLAASELVVVAIGRWFFSLQGVALKIFRLRITV